MGAMNELMIDKLNADREAVGETQRAAGKKPYVKPEIKKINVQRNDPCGCGSGKKFKNCCQLYARLKVQKRVQEERAKQAAKK